MRKGIKRNVLLRVNANRQRAADVQAREEREADAIRALNQKRKNEHDHRATTSFKP